LSPPRVLLAAPSYRGQNHALFLGLACLARTLRLAGAEVAVLDEDVAWQAESAGAARAEEIIKRVVDAFEPTLIGIHFNTPNYAAALDLSRRLALLTDAPIVAGGPHATAAAHSILTRHPQIAYILRGECDQTLPALAWAMCGRGVLDSVPGLSSRTPQGIQHQPRAGLLPANQLPTPDRSALLEPPDPILRAHARSVYRSNFSNTIRAFEGREVAGGYVSRGCYALCPFCSPALFWSSPEDARPIRRLRPVESVLDEMRSLRELGYGAVFFDEPTFPLSTEPAWVLAFCSGMRELDMLWGGPTRLNELGSELLPQLAEGGLRYVYFGLETPHHHLQQSLDKAAEEPEVHSVLRTCEAAGIQCDLSLFFGTPGEDDHTITRTLEWMLQHLPRGNAFFSLAAFWPRTAWSREAGLIPECWEPDYDKRSATSLVAVWYPETEVSIERFFSNSTGTYHPAFMSIERALSIKERIIESGFRARFSESSRSHSQGAAR
jgi:radical SAM superfamily enzyme YgiQ (UPF0313 family)